MKDSATPFAAPSQWLRLYTSAPYDCSYLPAEKARMQVLDPQATADTAIYAELIEQGFRRSGLSIYRPACPHCQRCLPLRVPVNRFTPNRSQRRAIQQHAALQVRLLHGCFSRSITRFTNSISNSATLTVLQITHLKMASRNTATSSLPVRSIHFWPNSAPLQGFSK